MYYNSVTLDGMRHEFTCERPPDERMQTDHFRAVAAKVTRKVVYRIGNAVDAEPDVVACWRIVAELQDRVPDALDALQALPADSSKQPIVDALNALHPRTPPEIWAAYVVLYGDYIRTFDA